MRIFFIVPNHKLRAHRDVFEGAVIDAAVVLENVQVLLALVSGALNESHPAGVVLVTRIKKTAESTVLVDLKGNNMLSNGGQLSTSFPG